MRKKYLLLLAAAVIAGGGIWHARSAWQAKRELVTLNIHAMPLPEVVRLIEAQTGKKIRAEKTLESACITLRVKNKPLAFVLDRIAGLAGAHWSRINGVYTSAGSLAALENSLSGDGKFESAGWTKIAPKLPDQDLPEEMAGEK